MLSGVGPATAKPVFKAADTLSRHLEELCRPGAWERRAKDGDKGLLEYVEAEARDLSLEAFGRLMSDLYTRIASMLFKGNDITRRMGGVLAIDELTDVKLSGDDAAKTSRLASMLSRVLEDSEDATLSETAAHTLGHLVRSGGAMTSDIVEKEIRRALSWCDPHVEPSESRRLTALLVLHEAAESAPAVFNVHVKSFIDAVWFPLRDPKQHIREAAVRALKACLCLVEKRETRYRVQWYYKLFEQTMRGMKRDHRTGSMPSAESIHGSLLALAELLQHTGEFMLARYKEVVENVFRYKDSKEKNIRRAVIHLLPRMAAFSPERFASEYLSRAIAFLLTVLKNPPERGAAFAALADMAAALARPIYAAIREALSVPPAARAAARPRPATCPEALQCVGMLAVALGPLCRPYAAALIESMVLTGISEVLVSSLTQVANALPELLEDIQYQLLDLLSLVLSKRPFNSATTQPKFAALSAAIAAGELQGNALIKLALQTLGTFDLGGIQLLEFMRDHILAYTEDPDKEIRQAAVLAACRVLERHAATALSAAAVGAGGRAVQQLASQQGVSVERCVNRLLVVAVADSSERVRKEVLLALVATTALDDYLAQADCLRALFVGMNDESCTVRALAIRLVGRLADRNPAHVNPALRKHLLQLLHDMEFSPDNRAREESAYLLEVLITSAAKLIMPYVSPIQKALVGKLRGIGPSILPTALGTVLSTLGALAEVSGTNFRPFISEVVPLVIEAIQDNSDARRRVVAVKTLGFIVSSCGNVMGPYLEYPQLLSVLLRMLHEGHAAQRREVIKVLGIIGALDPHTHKVNQASLSGEGKLEKEGVRPLRHGAGAAAAGGGGGGLDYYPTVAINALMRVLRDPALASQHLAVIRALLSIFKALQLNVVPYLPKVLPILFGVLRGGDEALREEILGALRALVGYVRQHMRRFLPELLQLIHEFWPTSPRTCLALIADLGVALRDDIRWYVPELLPKFVAVFGEAERSGSWDLVRPALGALEALGSAVDDSLHLLLPSMVRLISPSASSTPAEIRRAALRSMRKLIPRMQLGGYASAVLHPLIKVLDSQSDEQLRRDAIDTICAVAVCLGPDFAIFVPTIRKVRGGVASESDRRACGRFVDPSVHVCMCTEPPPVHSFPSCRVRPPDLPAAQIAPRVLSVNAGVLRRAWESSHRVTKEDWAEWMRNFSVELLKESPSPALRACYGLAQVHPTMARELFAAGFVSCWADLDPALQEQLVRSLEAALASPTIPPETVTALLNLAEFMEHDDKRLPLDTRTLGALAEKCHAFAKALHYKELEFQTSPQTAIEALIHINNQLRQPEAAVGVLTYAQKHLHMELKESWYEKLCRWDEALDAYERRLQREAPGSIEYHTALLGKMRCLANLAEWENLSNLCRTEWRKSEPHVRREMAMIAAHAAWHMGAWEEMSSYVDTIDNPDVGPQSQTGTGAFLRAVLCVRSNQFESAKVHVDRARELMVTDLAALVGESYERAYTDMVRVQQLAELEEVVAYKQALERRAAGSDSRISFIQQLWRDRLRGVQRHVEVWQSLFSIRSLVVPMAQDVDNWLKFASLCRKSGRQRQAYRMLLQLLRYNPMSINQRGQPGYGAGSGAPHVMLAFLKHLWTQGQRTEACNRLQDLAPAVAPTASATAPGGGSRWLDRPQASLNGRAFLRLGMWQWAMNDKLDNPAVIKENLESFRSATEHAPNWAKAWHQWALFNVAVSVHYSTRDETLAVGHVPPAVQGFFRSVALGQAAGDRTGNLQDILRLLTLWFNHGAYEEVRAALQEGFQLVSIDTWLLVIPQIIARIHTHNTDVRQLIHHLLVKIGRHHPQALMYPLLVATKSQSPARRQAAYSVLECIRQHSAALVEQAQLVSGELIRIAILWHEMWHEGLEEASRLYFGESNVEGMLNTLLPLHEMLEKAGPTTLKEIAFVQSYGRELSEAYEWLMKYKASRKEAELHQAWDLYYHVFKRINKQLHSLTTLELQYVSPALVRAQGLELAVPGTYIAGEPLVTIAAFAPQLHVISSKQRPRKLTIHGGDGSEYMFLLKGHEDLRQDERVMQLFGLVNTMLAHDRITAERDLSIARYAVIPLSPNSGLIGWVPNCDTLHALIREYREARKIPLNWEHRLMLGMAPDYDHLTVIQKVEVFEFALDSTSGEDLHKVLWLKSRNSEVWLDRRTNYTRSAAVMSMVGYILGLGDRHPSNLMLDRYSGKLLHIDFGDCFEASMNREKFPEKVPFRLTRMMIKAMEVSGIEGNFRTTCENVMRVLRSNKESVTAMLEAFVHDPLINWRLLNTTEAATEAALARTGDTATEAAVRGSTSTSLTFMPSPPRRETREKELKDAVAQLGDANEVLNTRAVEVMKRMSDKLMGRDYAPEVSVGGGAGGVEPDSVAAQVQRLIHQAVNHENLCQSYIGWCPFW
ncbi:target of rapamycin, growth-regulatory PI3K-like protein kinase [Volvox carteri f. nagariensis]|uniref:Serine/threonine-protein kinase TOR n=1 Tax=Volvox carteri f. nagariensis TaxID=3068 RepID=D8U7Q0_VOLCA|nr:target of rapamycin, growth-regulatory PI3K-like protein kinase [Volvox carteri f. nagariensis]EFJ44271.1 target of rapamycin, growth-regulatory PI3K-like protein kinase [Volvox carteri f. nagariensis]|eukprot:XP_002954630.1 target of rapamycin, growth-regulatory PI3K-like protein kinase [Volvox carteri f. nagariensis]